ncbi:hypothetical protein Pmani_030807 [Petrolisthes manimaculis]|uniref:Transmembrane protein 256 homolog n=1 Tax=Petrolisthes manimaculis TaxID=1843537 RepID=A0AAE1NWE9_9EUCA|nr:hypothetical protein Pmani_030807 [Petrolisthes manimaculis]
MVGDGYSWLWNNPVTREVTRCPKRIADLIWSDHHKGGYGSHRVTEKIVEVVPTNMLNIPSYARWFVRMAGISGATAVALGAYGAHVFYRREYPEELKQVYETANRYHFIHTLALLGVPLCKRPKLAGALLITGTAVFCGTCYYYALTGSKNVRQYTPYGGMLLIVGWLSMIF